jgi:hypothetical protein
MKPTAKEFIQNYTTKQYYNETKQQVQWKQAD